jgi:hypothetical protein
LDAGFGAAGLFGSGAAVWELWAMTGEPIMIPTDIAARVFRFIGVITV